MGQPCLILLRPAPSAVLVRDRGAVARVFPGVLEASVHAPARAPPRARARRGRRGLALIGARVATLREQADGESRTAGRRRGNWPWCDSPRVLCHSLAAPCPRRSDRLSVVSPPFTDFPA